jgi:hypothetical protein
MSSPDLTKEWVPNFARGRGHMASMRPIPPGFGAWFPNCSTIWRILWRYVHVLGLGTENAQNPGYSHTGAKWRTRDNKLEGEKWQEA